MPSISATQPHLVNAICCTVWFCLLILTLCPLLYAPYRVCNCLVKLSWAWPGGPPSGVAWVLRLLSASSQLTLTLIILDTCPHEASLLCIGSSADYLENHPDRGQALSISYLKPVCLPITILLLAHALQKRFYLALDFPCTILSPCLLIAEIHRKVGSS